jgi:hypothetical protein
MKTLYYSETLDKSFETEEECLQAEKENSEKLALVKAEKEERKLAAKEVEKAFEEANDAYKAAREKMNAFVERWGSYHLTLRDSNLPLPNFWDFFTDPWNFLIV